MLTGNQWWLFKFSERLNILWLEETTGDDEGAPCLCSSHYSKICTNYFTISKRILLVLVVKGEERRKSEERSVY